MGMTIWIDIEGRNPQDPIDDHSIMLRLEDNLAKIAKLKGVPKLTEFYVCSGGLFTFFRPSKWHDPSKALATLVVIQQHLLQHPDDLGYKVTESTKHWPSALMDELASCRGILEKAIQEKKKIRLLLVD